MTVRITNYSKESVTISGLDQKTSELLSGTVSGTQWFRVQDGVAEFRSTLEPLPNPVIDEAMLPFWKENRQKSVQPELFDVVFDELCPDALYFPHITISGLCGYNYSKENYERESKKLLSYGFIQMRSKRGNDGKFWEFWYLSGLWAVKGELKDVVDRITVKARTWNDSYGRRKDKECFDTVLEFLRKNVQFGSLDVSVQRMAMVIDD
jgi:hypothetical protein